MDLEAFKTLVTRVRHSKPDLLQLRIDARNKRETDREELVLEVLDEYYPGWDSIRNDVIRAAPNNAASASFKGEVRRFDHAIDACLLYTSPSPRD